MTESQINAIKSVIAHPGWQAIEDLIRQEAIDGKKPMNIATDGKSVEIIALEVMSRKKAAETIDKVLKKINRIGCNTITEKETWR